MENAPKKLALIVLAVFILLAVLMLPFHYQEPTRMAGLQLSGFETNSNQVMVAILVLTNPGPAQVVYSTIQERSGTNSFIGHGTLASRSTITYRIALSDRPVRLLIGCAPRYFLRELADQAANILGINTPPRSSEYAVFSDELTQ